MITIGLTGGIGSGKSVVALLLETYGIPVYIADNESKQLIASSPVIRERLITLLGESIYDKNGLNHSRMASLIFNDAKLLQQVNAIIHPEVWLHFQLWIKMRDSKYVALESAILVESDFYKKVDVSLMVYAPQVLRLNRVMARDEVSETDVLRRMKHQLPDEIKKERCDYVIYNDEKRPLIPQIEDFMVCLKS